LSLFVAARRPIADAEDDHPAWIRFCAAEAWAAAYRLAARPRTVSTLNTLQRSLFSSCTGEGSLYNLTYLILLPITHWYVACSLNIWRNADLVSERMSANNQQQ
jgi:hypothetical protein